MSISLLIIIILFIIVIVEFNVFIRLKNKIKQSKSSIDVYLTQRFDLIPNLEQCVKGYAKYEEATLKNISDLRSFYNETKDLEIAQDLTNKMNGLLARIEDYADLKANEQFLYLQKNLVKMESRLQAARRIYNGDVTLYNTTIQSFPNNIFAYIFNMKPESLFEADEYKTQNVEVDV